VLARVLKSALPCSVHYNKAARLGFPVVRRRFWQAAAAADPAVGYCQGMNFVAGSLLRAVVAASAPCGAVGDACDHAACTEAGVRAAEHAFAHRGDGGAERAAAALAAAEAAAEEQVFWLLVALMAPGGNGSSSQSSSGHGPSVESSRSCGGLQMRALWRPGVASALKLRAFQFDRLLKRQRPRLHAHFHAIGLAPEILVGLLGESLCVRECARERERE
jgi:hypothetical protein